jgi:hypothetical protein
MWQLGTTKAVIALFAGGVLLAGGGLATRAAAEHGHIKVPMGADPSASGVAEHECRMQVVDSVRSELITVRELRNPRDPRGGWVSRRELVETFSHRDSMHLRDCEDRFRTLIALRGESVRLGMLRLAIPEYNDEQRFLGATSAEFGPKVTIFASANLEGFRFEQQYESHLDRGVLVAVIFVDTALTADLSGFREYSTLGLGAGVNCLWVSYRSAPAPRWRARVSRARADWSCAEFGTPGTWLGVDRETYGPAVTFVDVPAVARFEWDAAERPLLGVKCLTGWCAIGPANASGDPAFTPKRFADDVPALAALGVSAAIPGWHDEQRLATYVNGMAVPGGPRATIVPATTTIFADIAPGVRSLIGYVYLHDDPTGTRYEDWGLRQGMNELYLARSASGEYLTFARAMGAGAPGAPARWTNVIRHEHVDAALVSTARFRWISTDDGFWVACGQGCCKMDGET